MAWQVLKELLVVAAGQILHYMTTFLKHKSVKQFQLNLMYLFA